MAKYGLMSFVVILTASYHLSADASPFARFTFDEGSGAVLNDALGTFNGTISGDAVLVQNIQGKALAFGAKGGSARIGNISAKIRNGFTFTAWVKKTFQDGGDSKIIFGSLRAWKPGSASFLTWIDDKTGSLRCGVQGASSFKAIGVPISEQFGAWFHLAFTYDRTAIRIYVNGVQRASDAFAEEVSPSDFWQFASVNNSIALDEACLYGAALTADEVRAAFAAEAPLALTEEEMKRKIAAASALTEPKAASPAVPEPAAPVYTALKAPAITTHLVKDGAPAAAIVAPASKMYDDLARMLQKSIADRTGVTIPIITDEPTAWTLPIQRSLFVLGNRSTSRIIEELYNRFYTLLDLAYPGKGGYEVRSLHDPFGNGHNIIFVGGSDKEGVAAAANEFIAMVNGMAGGRDLTVGHCMRIRLGQGIEVPSEVKDVELWDASKNYRSQGYFGWNSISKLMAMYYMTGNERFAREMLRYAFPDAKAKREISELDGELIENKDDPVGGSYHYGAHYMMLFWDLIEESPVFTDEERLKMANAFSRQFLWHVKPPGGAYMGNWGAGIYSLTEKPGMVGDRHGQWTAISIYVLARYFQKYYPSPMWAQCLRGVSNYFAPLDRGLLGEGSLSQWYITSIAPLFTYFLLSGERASVANGALAVHARGLEALLSGKDGDPNLDCAGIADMGKLAYLLNDGKYLEYQRRILFAADKFRIGQSFVPDERLTPRQPTDIAGTWLVHRLPEPRWRERNTGFPFTNAFLWASYRTMPDDAGDFIKVRGANTSARNPYHTFLIDDLRIDGYTLLSGFGNQLTVWIDGMFDKEVTQDAALISFAGSMRHAAVTAEVVKMPFSSWRRTVFQRTGSYALIVDDLSFRRTSDAAEVKFGWSGPLKKEAPGVLRCNAVKSSTGPVAGKTVISAFNARYSASDPDTNMVRPLPSYDIVLLRSRDPGTWFEMTFTLDSRTRGDGFLNLLNFRDRGIMKIFLDGRLISAEYDHYAPDIAMNGVPLGAVDCAAGEHTIRFEVTGKNNESSGLSIGVAGLAFYTDPSLITRERELGTFKVIAADAMTTKDSSFEWFGPVEKGGRRIFFSLIGKGTLLPGEVLSCTRLETNAAVFAAPEPAIAFAGEYKGNAGELIILGKRHLYGRGIRLVGRSEPLIRAGAPADIYWDFNEGTMDITAEQRMELALALSNDSVLVDGMTVAPQKKDGLMMLMLAAGHHTVARAFLPDALLASYSGRIEKTFADAQTKSRAELTAAPSRAGTPAMRELFNAGAGKKTSRLLCASFAAAESICTIDDRNIRVFSSDGRELRTLTADAPVRVIHPWKEYDLLLAGCADEKVIAFDIDSGVRKWTFTSEMPPEVIAAAKQYWFKSTYPGIYGIHTGVFLNGESQAFIGSTCTLEMLDSGGKLVKRLPVFWGPGTVFNMLDRSDGSTDLVFARYPNDGDRPAVINSRTLATTPRSYYAYPPGFTDMGVGWANMYRKHLFIEDMNGDGKKEVLSDINGVFNRIALWSSDGAPLFNVNFGPGDVADNIRDLDVGDLDGDGKKEIITATFRGILLVMDHTLEKVWSKRLASPATALKYMPSSGGPVIVVACEDGSVLTCNARGEITAAGTVIGRPIGIDAIAQGVVVATENGNVKGFAIH
ncbi:MAG: LamG-like jellyroll fold domain-containing protein [Spirochaetota bacterium]